MWNEQTESFWSNKKICRLSSEPYWFDLSDTWLLVRCDSVWGAMCPQSTQPDTHSQFKCGFEGNKPIKRNVRCQHRLSFPSPTTDTARYKLPCAICHAHFPHIASLLIYSSNLSKLFPVVKILKKSNPNRNENSANIFRAFMALIC